MKTAMLRNFQIKFRLHLSKYKIVVFAMIAAVTFSCQNILAEDSGNAESLYREGKIAFDSGDCETAIVRFVQFKRKTSSFIEENKQFYNLIDEKIATCSLQILTKKPSNNSTGEHLRGSGMSGLGHITKGRAIRHEGPLN